MQGSAISLFEGGRHPYLTGKYPAQTGPALIDAMPLELSPQNLDCETAETLPHSSVLDPLGRVQLKLLSSFWGPL